MNFAPETTIEDALRADIEQAFYDALWRLLEHTRKTAHAQVDGVHCFRDSTRSVLAIIGHRDIPKELEPEWLAKIDAILDEVTARLHPQKETD